MPVSKITENTGILEQNSYPGIGDSKGSDIQKFSIRRFVVVTKNQGVKETQHMQMHKKIIVTHKYINGKVLYGWEWYDSVGEIGGCWFLHFKQKQYALVKVVWFVVHFRWICSLQPVNIIQTMPWHCILYLCLKLPCFVTLCGGGHFVGVNWRSSDVT